jgi:MFS family permease
MATQFADDAPTAGGEWASHWPLVFASTLAVSWVAAPVTSLSLFLEPLHKAFGWSFAEISSGLFLYSVISVLLVPVAGAIVDRFGTRPIGLAGLLLNGLAFAGFGLVNGSIATWFTAWVFYTLSQLLMGTYVWSGAISAAFVRSRGLAIGITMGGIAIGQLIAPLTARWLIDAYGWRAAFAILGIGWTGIAFLVGLVFFHDPRARVASAARENPTATARAIGGLTLAQAIRSPRFQRITVAILLQAMIISGITVHVVRLLSQSGISRETAATMAGLVGIAALAGQVFTGWLADRVSARVLPVVCFALPAIAYALLQFGAGSAPMQWAGVLLAGYASGAAINITTYLTTRYVGLAHFGKNYGVISSAMRLGAGLGPFIAGAIADRTGSYADYLMLGIACAIVAGLLVLGLGPYPDFDDMQAETFA